MAEIESNVMIRQCLPRRIDTIARLKNELSAWETERNFVAPCSSYNDRCKG